MAIWTSFEREGCVRKNRSVVLHAQHRIVICRGLCFFSFFCSIMEWDKRSYEGKYDSVKGGTAENRTVMP